MVDGEKGSREEVKITRDKGGGRALTSSVQTLSIRKKDKLHKYEGIPR